MSADPNKSYVVILCGLTRISGEHLQDVQIVGRYSKKVGEGRMDSHDARWHLVTDADTRKAVQGGSLAASVVAGGGVNADLFGNVVRWPVPRGFL